MTQYTVILSPDPDAGGYSVFCPSMPGACAEGESRASALDAMSRVMALWIEVAAEDNYGPQLETPDLVAAKIASVIEDRSEAGWDLTIETVTLRPATAVTA